MNPYVFIANMNRQFKDLELLDQTWLRMVEELLTRVEIQDSEIACLIAANKKLLAKKK